MIGDGIRQHGALLFRQAVRGRGATGGQRCTDRSWETKPQTLAEAHLWDALRLGLQERGWIEGGNMLIEYRWVEGNFARLPELASDLVRLKVDLIVARASIRAQAAKRDTSSPSSSLCMEIGSVGPCREPREAGWEYHRARQSDAKNRGKRLELLEATIQNQACPPSPGTQTCLTTCCDEGGGGGRPHCDTAAGHGGAQKGGARRRLLAAAREHAQAGSRAVVCVRPCRRHT